MEVLQWLHKMLGGSSPQTGYIGSVGIITSLIDIVSGHVTTAMAETGGTPTTKLQWLILGLCIAVRLAKDANKTNSQHPTAVAVTVPAISASPVTVLSTSGQVFGFMSPEGKFIPTGPSAVAQPTTAQPSV